MTRKTDPKPGNDPLARMEEGTDGNTALRAEPKPVERRVKRRRKADQAVDLGLPVQVLEDSFALLAPQAEQLVARFYNELFRRYPAVEPLFSHTTRADQQRKLLAALKLMVNHLRKPEALVKALQEMGARHQGYGAHPDHYRAVADTLLDVMAELAGDAWTDEVENAWEQALSVVAETMLKAYKPVEEVKMAARKEDVKSRVAKDSVGGVMNDIGALTRILEDAAVNVMIADADENIVFVNRRARQVLTELEDELATYLPGFRADEVVGGSIHRYHKDPDAIRRILARLQPGDVREGEITPGPFVFEHETRVLTDAAGNRLGYVVQWHDATEMRKREEQAQRLQRAIEGAQTAMMTINRDLVIEYVNGETRDLMRRNAEDLRKLYPGFDPENLVGTCIDIFHKNPAHQRQLLANPANLPFETDIHVGHLTFHIRVSAINDLKGQYVGCTLEWSDVTSLRERETEVARLMSAVEGATANLMMCDEDLNITYCNPAVMELFRNRAGELRQVFPGFDPNNLVGQNIDKFHRNPAHQRALLSDASRLPAKADIKVLDIEFQVNATMITGPNGEYMGNMVEWKDITEQKDAERQIERLIEAAVQGNLEQRIDTGQYAGFMKGLGTGINHLLDAVVEPMRESTRVMKSLAEGDLTQAMEGEFNGEFAEMRDAVNASVANLMQMVAEIRSTSTNITSAASEISQGNADLSQRTEEQASSLEETASSMEELTSTVRQNADNARQANQLASGAREQAEKGGDVVGKAVEAMVEINTASKKIAEIIGVIDEIAFQTNLLALNAAVEAARAGEQGRGFAVVAAEVRNLAQRSAGAAKEIKALIKDSVDKVDEGSRLVDESGKTLGDIVTAVKKVSDIIAEITAASQEQSAGIEQVNKAVMQLDEMTQQNAALVEEAAAASEALDDQAQGLNQRMSFFNVGDLAEPAPAPVQRRSRPAPGRAAAARPAGERRPNPVSGRAVPPPVQAGDDGEWEDF